MQASVKSERATALLDSKRQRLLWILAVLLYGVGDTVTTILGLRSGSVAEIGPIALVAFDHAGVGGFLALKAVFFGACFVVWYLLPTPSRLAIPLALAVVGVGVTSWNVAVIVTQP